MCDTEFNILKFLGINRVICRLLRSSVVTLLFRAYSSLISSGENFVHLIIRSLIEHFEPVWGFVVPNAVKNMAAKMNSFSLAIVVSSSALSEKHQASLIWWIVKLFRNLSVYDP